MKLTRKQKTLQRRRFRIRKKVKGTPEKPRLSIHFSEKHIRAQCIDDTKGVVVYYLSTLCKDLKGDKLKPNLKDVPLFGKLFGEKVKASGVSKVVFDRGGHRYHGRRKSFADAVREVGIIF